LIVPLEPVPLEKKGKLVVIVITSVIMVFVGVVVVSAMAEGMEYYPEDGFTILKKEMLHTNGSFYLFGLGGYDMPVFYFTESEYVPVMQTDYDKYQVGDFFNGSYVCYG
jgi:hypothetical protein